MALLDERKIDMKLNIYNINMHIILLNFWGKPVIIQSSIPAVSEWNAGICRMEERFCPPLERQSLKLSIPVKILKNSVNHSMIWKHRDVAGTGGTSIGVVFSESLFQKWIYDHWLSLIAVSLGTTAVTLGLINLFRR